ncbi:hypothetical protein ABH940_005088 [Streptacidiphilus sp. BW17]|uniref:HNH endonuclease n=1 Tax=Streptacidiphilus sp. BW17 TaxID=3156274 RepID=UPI0035176DEB
MGSVRKAKVTEAVKRELWRLGLGMCYLCREPLDSGIGGTSPTAHYAHIVAQADKGPRAVPGMPQGQRDAVTNLILLCPGCHDLIDKQPAAYPTPALQQRKVDHETYAASLRESGRLWRVRYATVDYLNMPRMAMRESGALLQLVADRVGFDTNKAFHGQGIKSGQFVGQLRSVFEGWNEQATPLDEDRVESLAVGMLVSFSGAMRCRNAPTIPPAPLEGTWEHDPQLTFQLGLRTVRVRFDPAWLTTTTATTDLRSDDAQHYAGVGFVVGISDRAIKVSALVFGHPQTQAASLFEVASTHDGSVPRQVPLGQAEHSPAQPLAAAPRQSTAMAPPVSVALHFDEDEVLPGWIERATICQAARVVPEYRRDCRVGTMSLLVRKLLEDGGVDDLAAKLLSLGGERHWSSFEVVGLAALLATKNVAVAVVEGLRAHQLQDLHEALLEQSEPYLGALELDARSPLHRRAYASRSTLRLVGADLRVLYSVGDYLPGEWDHRDHSVLDTWEKSGLFPTVSWEEDAERSAAEERDAWAQFRELQRRFGVD